VQGIFIGIHTLVSILLIIVILMQASQGGGLSGTFGSTATSAIMGGRGAASFLSKLTAWLAGVFLVLAILISFFSTPSSVEPESLLKQQSEGQAVTPGEDLSLPLDVEPSEVPIEN